MTPFNKDLLWVSIATLALTGCGSSSNSSSDNAGDDHDHEHGSSILVSQTDTTALSLLEDGQLENLDGAAAGNGATFVLSDTGAYAAVLSVSGTTVNFVHGLHEEVDHDEEEEEEHEHEEEAHLLDHSETGSQVITTGGHFAILNAGTTTFIEYDELENDTPVTEDTSALSLTETYPALVIDEEHELQMVFAGGTAAFYEAGLAVAGESYACANPTSHGQTSELVVVSCDEGTLAVVIEEESGEHSFDDSLLSLDGTASNYIWQAQGHVIAGFEPGTTNYAVVELDESGVAPVVEVVKGSDSGTFAFTDAVCDLQLDSEAGDVLTITSGGKFVALDHEGAVLKNITLDESTASTCDDFVLASAAKTALVVDNQAQKGYEIDVDEPASNPNGYHVHERFNLTVSDISSLVIFHEMDEEGDHAH